MNELSNPNGSTQITAQDEVINAHQFLKEFIAEFDHAKRGGIHDFMEIALYNMISSSIKNIDTYLQSGHHQVNATEIMHIVADSYQKVLDGIKRNLGEMRPVNFR
jgi:phosphopantothenate synthetase